MPETAPVVSVTFLCEHDLAAQVEQIVASQREHSVVTPKITQEQSEEAQRLARQTGLRAANDYLTKVQVPTRRPSRTSTINDLIRIGLEHYPKNGKK